MRAIFFSSDSQIIKSWRQIPESRASSGFAENRNCSDSERAEVPIRSVESELTAARINEVVGNEPKRAFARRAGISETALLDYIKLRRTPKRQALASIAEAGAVSTEWLTTGIGPKTRAEQRATQGQAQYLVGGEAPPPARIDYPLLRQCLGACNIVYGDAFTAAAVARQLEHAVDLYNALLPNVSPKLSLEDISRREARGLADMLRGFIALGLVRPFE